MSYFETAIIVLCTSICILLLIIFRILEGIKGLIGIQVASNEILKRVKILVNEHPDKIKENELTTESIKHE